MPQLDVKPTTAPPSPGRRSISLVLPAWNEAEALPRALDEADRALRLVADDYEILVVDDGSADETSRVVQEAAERLPAVRLVRHEVNRGYGAALRTGFTAARCDLVAFTDADNQFDLTELDRFVLLAEQYQVVCGYRIDRKDSGLRRFYSRGYNVLVQTLLGTGVRDIDCALKMFHRDVVRRLAITTDGFLANSELLTQANQLGCSIVEVGVSHRPRVEGTSTVSAWHIPGVLGDLLRFWWNRVQFPGEPSGPPAPWRRLDAVSALLLVVAGMLLLSNLGYPLIGRDESRYAEIPREMVATGDWVVPQLNFQPYYDKPPLLYWLGSLSYSALGVSEFAARLPQVLCAFGTLLATFVFSRRWLGPQTGLASLLVLLVSVGYFGTSRFLLIDGLLTFLVTLSLGFAYEAVRGETLRLGWWLMAAVACGGAFLAKGPVALVLLVPPIAAYSFLTRGASRPKARHWALLAGVTTAMAAPWFVAVAAEDPTFIFEFFYRHNVARFAGAFHAQPFWYFLPIVLVAGHPWSFLTVSLAGRLGCRSAEARASRPPVLGFLALWAGWCVLFFSLSSCKLPSYIMPALPALAVLMGHYVQGCLVGRRLESLSFFERVAPWNAAAVTGLSGVGFAVFCGVAGAETATVATAAAAFWLVLTVGSQLLRFRVQNATSAWGVCLAMTVMMGLFVTHREMPQFARLRTLFGAGSSLADSLQAAPATPIATLSHEWAEAPFYLERDDIQNLDLQDLPRLEALLGEEGRVLIVMRQREDVHSVSDALPAATVREVGRHGSGAVYELVATPSVARAAVAPSNPR